ncbi:MAG: hemolysin family protein, partial [Pyrinomonadaceae bacterium]
MEIELVVAALLLVGLVFLATIDMALSHQSDVTLRRIAADADEVENSGLANFLRQILDDRPKFRFALSFIIQIILICFAILTTLILLRFDPTYAELLTYGLIGALIGTVLFRQIIPRIIVQNNSEKKLLFLLPVIRPLYSVVSMFAGPFVSRSEARERQKLESSLTPDPDEKVDDNADEFQALMEVGEAEGIIEEKERELIETMVEFSDTRAGEIMTPRTEICALPQNSTVQAARDLIISEKYSRLPVYRDSIDNIEGVIYVRDLLLAWSDGKEDQPISEMLREAYFVPETKSAAELLKSMQSNHIQIAIVVDEYGGVAGIITVEDILEEIVGEIEDEDIEDEEIIEIIEGADGYWDVLGSTEIDKIERLLDIELEDEEVTTIAGLVT